MFEPSHSTLIHNEEEKQQHSHEEMPAIQRDEPPEMAIAPEPAVQENTEATVAPDAAFNQHSEAGRKGARRIHQLIEQGKLYEREHGLKPGRQRLRQLIQEGKLYEQEHGLKVGSKRAREGRRTRISHEQQFKNFLQALLRVTKPTYRARLLDVLQAIEGESK
ncbi:MAG TPA: hypothetical protein VKU02_29220 [Gemmataceae bacterium]|nr:hypothetical protein [Gemmataceae bacterium]